MGAVSPSSLARSVSYFSSPTTIQKSIPFNLACGVFRGEHIRQSYGVTRVTSHIRTLNVVCTRFVANIFIVAASDISHMTHHGASRRIIKNIHRRHCLADIILTTPSQVLTLKVVCTCFAANCETFSPTGPWPSYLARGEGRAAAVFGPSTAARSTSRGAGGGRTQECLMSTVTPRRAFPFRPSNATRVAFQTQCGVDQANAARSTVERGAVRIPNAVRL